nr:5423_t:CDS:2 [Entrophospora candida]CAG8504266.1 15220_t:CDS:2 [Entrophospora candida]
MDIKRRVIREMRLAELETIRWDQKENFTAYITRFRDLVNASEMVDAPELDKIELFLQTLPLDLIKIIRKQITDQKILDPNFKPTLKQIMEVAANNADEIGNKSFSKLIWLLCDKLWSNLIFLSVKSIRNPKNSAVCIATLGLLIIFLVRWFSDAFEPSIFSKFVDSTDTIFKDINAVNLPGSNEVMKHTVACRRAANMVERDPAFKNSGHVIASKLRQFGEKVSEAGNDLQIMYRKGSFVFETFKIEIEAMMDRLDTQDRNKGEFFRERIKKMILTVQDFSKKVKIAKDSMLNAENHRDGLEKDILTGIREAEKFINTGSNSVDLRKAKDGLGAINDILYHLHNTAVHLDEVIKKLRNYENKLTDVQAELSDIFVVTKSDFKFLLVAVQALQRSHHKFMAKEDS